MQTKVSYNKHHAAVRVGTVMSARGQCGCFGTPFTAPLLLRAPVTCFPPAWLPVLPGPSISVVFKHMGGWHGGLNPFYADER